MIPLISISVAQTQLATHARQRRITLGLTQEGLSRRAGVNLFTLRKFEQKGLISLESFLKIAMVLGVLDQLISAIKPTNIAFSSIDEVIAAQQKIIRKRGRRK